MSDSPKKPSAVKSGAEPEEPAAAPNAAAAASAAKPKCGVIMPISEIDGCSATHWAEVLRLITETLSGEFEVQLVSDSNEVAVIQDNIVRNLANFPIAVCDVSAKNANVMFELGMRLAFNKPTVIIMDDRTVFVFDIGMIQHVRYQRDLRFYQTRAFSDELLKKVLFTYSAGQENGGLAKFLERFPNLNVKAQKLEEREVSQAEFVVGELREMRGQLSKLLSARENYLPDDGQITAVKLSVGSRDGAENLARSLCYLMPAIQIKIAGPNEDGDIEVVFNLPSSYDKRLVLTAVSATGVPLKRAMSFKTVANGAPGIQ